MAQRLTIQVLLIGMTLTMLVPGALADRKDTGFDSKQEYDIFFYSGEYHTAVLENVNIIGFKTIAGKEFLEVRSKGFKLTEESGYIDFESVIAILPDRHFRVRKTNGIRLRD